LWEKLSREEIKGGDGEFLEEDRRREEGVVGGEQKELGGSEKRNVADEDKGALIDRLRGLFLERAIGLSNCFDFL
jgi:hypothetical protein